MAAMNLRILPVLFLASRLLPCALATELYVATDGDDGNAGTLAAPFASLERAQRAASPGDTVWIRGGVYKFSGGRDAGAAAVTFDKSGAPEQRIHYWAYQDERPIFDFYDYQPRQRIRGFRVTADWLHFKGLELRGVQQTISRANESWGIRVEGRRGADHNIFEQLDLHHNEGPGLFIQNGAHNLVLNCDSHHNYDPDRRGENADGFGCHSDDDGNQLIGCRAWHNSDDGYDLVNSRGRVEMRGCWAWHNGFVPDSDRRAGNGAGFKAGGFLLDARQFPPPDLVPRHLVQGCLAFDNRAQGFYANHHPGGIDWVNNTAFHNPHGFNLKADVETDTWPARHMLRNNLAFSNRRDVSNVDANNVEATNNSWQLDTTVSEGDFQSIDPAGVDGPRGAEGELPELRFLRLAKGSPLVDSGLGAIQESKETEATKPR